MIINTEPAVKQAASEARRPPAQSAGKALSMLDRQPIPQSTVERPPALTVRNLRVAYGANEVLPGITLTVGRGQLVGVLGPNGSGKTTLMKAVLGLAPVQQGEILIDGQPLPHARGRVAYIAQQGAVNPRFPATVFEVVMMGRTRLIGWLRRPGPRDHQAVRQAIAQVGMSAFADASIHELSGGQQQRVYLAQALAQEADLFLLDEPVSGVDVPSTQAFYELLVDLRHSDKTILLSTHELKEYTEYYDRLLLLNHGVVAYGPPDQVLTQTILDEAYGQRVTTSDGCERTVLSMGGHGAWK